MRFCIMLSNIIPNVYTNHQTRDIHKLLDPEYTPVQGVLKLVRRILA